MNHRIDCGWMVGCIGEWKIIRYNLGERKKNAVSGCKTITACINVKPLYLSSKSQLIDNSKDLQILNI